MLLSNVVLYADLAKKKVIGFVSLSAVETMSCKWFTVSKYDIWKGVAQLSLPVIFYIWKFEYLSTRWVGR